MERPNFSNQLIGLAHDQHGLLTVEQIQRFGSEPGTVAAAIADGSMTQVLPGVLLLGNESWRGEELLAWWLKFDPARTLSERLDGHVLAAASHESAAYLHGLAATPQDLPTFKKFTSFPFGDRRVRLVEAKSDSTWVLVDGFPVVSVLETIRDLLLAEYEIEQVASVSMNALERNMIDEASLEDAIAPFRQALQIHEHDRAVETLRGIDGGLN